MTDTKPDQERVMELMADALEKAQTGLQWYLGEYPDYKSPADDEMHEEIDIALAEYRKLKVKPDPLAGTPDGLVG